MVWFQCEDCGENLKKPKLPNHFRMCSATKLSCIDCGEMFGRQSVQGHTQCITEAEKYGPKGQEKYLQNAQHKPNKPKPNQDIDINVGLSSRPPWKCSLCNTTTTSKQTLLLHADGKKHRAKARAFHAAQNQPLVDSNLSRDGIGEPANVEVNGTQSAEKLQEEINKYSAVVATKEETEKDPKKRKKEKETIEDVSNGEVIQADTAETDPQRRRKKKKCPNKTIVKNRKYNDENSHAEESPMTKIKWKKIITSALKSNSDGVMKIKRLQKLVLNDIKESGVNIDEDQLRDKFMDKITCSSRFAMDGRRVLLATKVESS